MAPEHDELPVRAPPRLRFTRRMRLVRERDFRAVWSEGSRARGPLLGVVVRENGLDVTRLGLSVGKRAHRKAVDRNRTRRVFREAFRLSSPELPQGFDVVMIAPVPGMRARLEPTRQELVRLVRKACAKAVERARRAAEGGT